MILTGKEILNNLGKGITIDPFDVDALNPNSYNLKIHNEITIYTDAILDAKVNNPTQTMPIPDEGYVLEPGELYLVRTLEYTETHGFVPMLIGRSSIGRLGISIHVTSGFGDIGFCGYWTLQVSAIKRVRIYPYMKLCQIYYQTVYGDFDKYSSDKYQDSMSVVASRIYKEL